MERNQRMSFVTRRDMLKTIGAGAAVFAAGSCLAGESKPASEGKLDLKSKAKKNLKLGIFTSVYAGLPLEEAARRIKEDGFHGVVCDYLFKDVRFDPLAPDWEVAGKIRKCLERNGIEVVGLFGYYNLVDPDEARRKQGEARMDLLIKNWKRLGCKIISTETGTFNTESQWKESPENYTEKGYNACRQAMEKNVRSAEKTGAIIAIETYWRNVIDSAERAERLFKDIDSPSLKLTMDPCNFFRSDDLKRMKPMLEDIFKRVGRQTVLAHAKDVKASPNGPEHPAAGKGVIDYPLFLRLLAELDKEYWLVLEHLTIDDVARSRDYVKGQMEKL